MLVKQSHAIKFESCQTADRGSIFCHCLFTTYAIITIYSHYTNYFDGKEEKLRRIFCFPFTRPIYYLILAWLFRQNIFYNYLPFRYLPLYIEQVYAFRKQEDLCSNQRATSIHLRETFSKSYLIIWFSSGDIRQKY